MRGRKHKYKTDKNKLLEETNWLIKEGQDPKFTLKLIGVRHILEGHGGKEAGELVGRHSTTVSDWFCEADMAGTVEVLRPKPNLGSSRRLDAGQEAEIVGAVLGSKPSDGGPWTCKAVAKHIRDKYDVSYTSESARLLMRRNGLSYGKPNIRPCRNEDAEVRSEFKKN